jgi:hypothetical protein
MENDAQTRRYQIKGDDKFYEESSEGVTTAFYPSSEGGKGDKFYTESAHDYSAKPASFDAFDDLNIRKESFEAMARAEYERDLFNAGAVKGKMGDPYLVAMAQARHTLSMSKIEAWGNEIQNKFRLINQSDIATPAERNLLYAITMNRTPDPVYIPKQPAKDYYGTKKQNPLEQLLSGGMDSSIPSEQNGQEATQPVFEPGTSESLFTTAATTRESLQMGTRAKERKEQVEEEAPKQLEKSVSEINMAAGLWDWEKSNQTVQTSMGTPSPVPGKLVKSPDSISIDDLKKLDSLSQDDKIEFNSALATGNPEIMQKAIKILKTIETKKEK